MSMVPYVGDGWTTILSFVCTVLTGENNQKVEKSLRLTPNNRKHVEDVWGKDGVKEIYIPVLINDYNHWMGGVNLIDQQIA